MIFESRVNILTDVSDIVSAANSAIKNKKNTPYSTDLKLCLPPIATFSHHCTSLPSGRSRSSSKHCFSKENDVICKCQRSPTDRLHSASSHITVTSGKRHRRLFSSSRSSAITYHCNWPSCPQATIKKPFKKACHLRYHMSLHTGDTVVSCPECGRQFNRSCYLKQHMVVHSNDKRYVCQYCNRKYTHKSEASLCRKRHRAKDEQQTVANKTTITETTSTAYAPLSPTVAASHQYAENNAPPQSAIVKTQLSALELEVAMDRSRVRPYACTICPRRYTDPSSLRKHTRSHHLGTTEQEQQQRAQKADHVDHVADGITHVVSDPLTARNKYQTKQPDIQPIHSSRLQTAMPTTELQLIPDINSLVYTSTLHTPQSIETVALPSPGSTNSHQTVNLEDGITKAYKHHLTVEQRLTGSDADLPLTPSAYWNYPVDLCNSAMCLQTIPDRVVDVSSSSRSEENTQAQNATTWSLGNGITETFATCQQDGALDLTDAPSYLVHLSVDNEAIDLSGNETMIAIPAYPIDLSSTHPFIHPSNPSSQHDTSTTASTIYQYGLSSSIGGNALRVLYSVSSDSVDMQHLAATGHLPPTVTELHSNWEPEPGFSFTDLLLASGDEPLLEIPQYAAAISFVDHYGPSALRGDTLDVDKVVLIDNDNRESEALNTTIEHQHDSHSDCRIPNKRDTTSLSKCLPPLDLRLSL